MPIAHAIRKYGSENFKFEVVQTCTSQDELNAAEKAWAEMLGTFAPHGYNLKAGNGFGAMAEELKKKIGDRNRGRVRTAATIKKLSKSHMGQVISTTERKRRSDFMQGKTLPQSVRDGARQFNQKTYVLRSPECSLVTFTNMKQFCKQQGLWPSMMSRLVRGKIQHCKGWTFVSATQSRKEARASGIHPIPTESQEGQHIPNDPLAKAA